MSILITKKDILNIPFQSFTELETATEITEFVKENKAFKANWTWIMPQILAFYGSWNLVRGENGLIDPKATSKENIKSEWDLGLWKFITRANPSSYITKQANKDGSKYGTLTPIILAGSKFSKNIPYKEWDISRDCKLISERLLDAMFSQLRVSMEDILEYRSNALKDKSAVSTWNPLAHSGTPFSVCSSLARVMYIQSWLAHPSLRDSLMILDPNDWDNMPEPIDKSNISCDLPW
jgi:hypothetical protein